jgi:hypothetical protein
VSLEGMKEEAKFFEVSGLVKLIEGKLLLVYNSFR